MARALSHTHCLFCVHDDATFSAAASCAPVYPMLIGEFFLFFIEFDVDLISADVFSENEGETNSLMEYGVRRGPMA